MTDQPYEEVDHPVLRDSDIARFWKYVDKRGPDECWPWMGSRQERRGGYGQLRFGATILRANRIAFFLARGYWPKNALHTCDFPPCCNEAHIYDGTIANNVSDMRERGRGFDIPPMPGESCPAAKLTRSQAETIFARYSAGGITMLALAQEHGVTKAAVWRLVHKKTWGEIHERAV